MALKTAFISEHQTRFLDCVVGDQCQVQIPAEVSDALSGFSYDANCFYSKSNGKKLYRKKSRSKAKFGKKKADKVFPEEFFSDTGKEQHLSSSKCPTSHKHSKTPSSSDLVKEDLSPTLRLSHSCIELKNLSDHSDVKGHSREEVHECSISEISNCKACPLPKRKLHNPQCFSGTSQDMCGSVSSNNGHPHVPKSRATGGSSAKKKRSNINNLRKKDQSRLTWKKCQDDRSNETRTETMSLPDHANFDSVSQTSSVPSQQAALSCDELAVTSNFSAKQKKAATATKSLDADNMLNRGSCVDISVESCERVAEGVSSEYQDSLFSTKPIEMIHVVKLEESNGHRNKFGKRKNNCWKATRGPSSKSHRHHRQPFPFPPQHAQSKEKVYSKDTSTFDPLHPGMKLPAVKPIEEKHIQNVMNGWSDATCFKSNMTPGIRRAQDSTQHQSVRKWIPVFKKSTSIPETPVTAVTNESINDNSSLEKKEDIYLEDSIPEAPIEHISSNLLSDDDIPSLMEQAPDKVECADVQSVKNYTQSIHASEGLVHHPVDSQFVEQAFISSYRMQLASEGVHRTTGYPLAEFERLLFSATPTIDSSILSKPCDGSFSDMLSSLILRREQTPNISLHSVFNWYEEPGNYGLKVDVNRSHIQEGCVAGTASFHAHFVPLLSAIQLFGHNYPSSSLGKRQDQSLEAHGVEASLQTPLCGNPAIDVHDVTKPFNAAGPLVLSNAELLFEFFESEQPQRRKPLHNKIVDLASEGTSNNQVFGDPSKLDCTSLVDLHPASWFSVAWYPIYRIPEGKMRAAFLTYHSLGYFVQRCTTNNSPNLRTFSLALPVIGLQSYSAQAELWFSLNMESESSLGQMSSAVLKERLRTLEENANFFARGSVFKDHIMVTNRQPDYEFFMSRKGKPLYL